MSTTIISKEMALKFYKLTKYMTDMFSNEFKECDRHGCMIISKCDFKIIETGVSSIIYEDTSKRIIPVDKKLILYNLTAVEDCITKASKFGDGLDDCIAITTKFPSIKSLKLLLQSGVNTIVTNPCIIEHEIELTLLLDSFTIIFV